MPLWLGIYNTTVGLASQGEVAYILGALIWGVNKGKMVSVRQEYFQKFAIIQ